ncbi:hypothetical protein BC830DRAFT_1118330 [Chytriomyces sp. MP71]|nr:hypothetical protein BC830DRAFT_1118330 [Chytriomyces sp. MP71]
MAAVQHIPEVRWTPQREDGLRSGSGSPTETNLERELRRRAATSTATTGAATARATATTASNTLLSSNASSDSPSSGVIAAAIIVPSLLVTTLAFLYFTRQRRKQSQHSDLHPIWLLSAMVHLWRPSPHTSDTTFTDAASIAATSNASRRNKSRWTLPYFDFESSRIAPPRHPPSASAPASIESTALERNPTGRILMCMEPYVAQERDELSMNAGDRVLVLQSFPDGWAVGVQVGSLRRGVFPLVSCRIPEEVVVEEEEVYVPGPKKAETGRRDTSYSYVVGGVDAIDVDTSKVVVRERRGSLAFKAVEVESSVGAVAPGAVQDAKKVGVVETAYGNGVVMRVIHAYEAQAQDEVSLKLNQVVILLRQFEDEWGFGVSPVSGAAGMFPLPCVNVFEVIEVGGSIVGDILSDGDSL